MNLKLPFAKFWSLLFRCLGLVASIFVLVGVIGIPRPVAQWMTMSDATLRQNPAVIVVLGGAGIPSESGLVRTYFGAQASHLYPEAEVIVSLPTDGDPDASSVGRMRDELIMRGVPANLVQMEYKALNTHEQAEAMLSMLGRDRLQEPLLIVTSAEHMRRSILAFRRSGFMNVGGMPAVDAGADAYMGERLFYRYGFWSTLQTEVAYLRELIALVYYRARGWV
ncbi:MAG: YdcF family protein [Verrucomicrobia bacterium]|nr:YdcF family protein [Verrucomicrobiota bacterium]